MTYSVVDAQRSDADELSSIFLDAFKEDPMLGQIWPNVAPDVLHAYHTRQFVESFENMEPRGIVFKKVVDQESRYAVPFIDLPTPWTTVLGRPAMMQALSLVKEATCICEMAISAHHDRWTKNRKGDSRGKRRILAWRDKCRAAQSLLRSYQRRA